MEFIWSFLHAKKKLLILSYVRFNFSSQQKEEIDYIMYELRSFFALTNVNTA